MNSFNKILMKHNIKIYRKTVETLQINMGKLCNQACVHCHVEAGPKRTEIMNFSVVQQILKLLKKPNQIKVVDITGGAPELNEHFKYLIKELKALNLKIIDRCNLTVLHEKGQEKTAMFLAENNVAITASLPCYTEQNVEQQRGRGVFVKSIESLKKLNALGYGCGDENLKLSLVYNPLGAFLPPIQEILEKEYKEFLSKKFQVNFDHLLTLTNMPIKRFRHTLKRKGELLSYQELLSSNFNPDAAENVMCKKLLSISWDGKIYDCDFNQMLEMPVANKYKTIFQINNFEEVSKEIITKEHCFGCTAGAGSSCGGSLI